MRSFLAVAVLLLTIVPVLAQPAWTPGESRFIFENGTGRATTTGQRGPDGRDVLPSDRFAIASVAKLYLAVALLRAQEDGLIDLDTPVGALLPRDVTAPFGGLKATTTRHLLAMRSGLPDYLDDQFVEDILARRLDDPLAEALVIATDQPRLFPAGAGFDYSNTNYLLAELVLHQATGRSTAENLARYIFAPLGLSETARHGPGALPDVAGYEAGLDASPSQIEGYYAQPGFADGGLIASARDVAAVYRALFLDRTLLGGRAFAELIADAEGDGYGLGVNVDHDPTDGPVYGHAGGDLGFASYAEAIPRRGRVTVILSADADADP
ncbi:serine hydrolase domain-containing protein [Roseobacter sp. HKCCA0434]|uniref:serine hydrolase domain-containing protein n=1 Tax=Roseobacter sp. HKCCA0434 TaxID=3079297 RepID=UPI002905C52C|nr:serine hydrolase domain-containing protein [Roseobacter sp. HKCCA0434]